MTIKIFLISVCSIFSLYASDSFNREASHFTGGAVMMTDGITAVIIQSIKLTEE